MGKMKASFFRLHLSVLIAGFTGIFGKIITMDVLIMNWYRAAIAIVLLYIILNALNKFHKLSFKEAIPILFAGCTLSLNWFLFYGSIKASNVSVGVACIPLIGFFSAILEPLLLKKRFEWSSLCYSSFALIGVLLIFHLDVKYRVGITMGIMSSLVAAIFSIMNKSMVATHRPQTILFYELIAAFLTISIVLPFYLKFMNLPFVMLKGQNLIYMFIFVGVCTIMLWLLQIQAMETISAFTVNLAYNLEPLYSITIAIIFLNELKELGISFFIGMIVIVMSVVLQSFSLVRNSRINVLQGE